MTVTVLSPHFDDAAFSVGGLIHRLARSGTSVTVITVFGNSPTSPRAASSWDHRAGFRTEGEAAIARREEDIRCWDRLGGTPVHLDFEERDYRPAAAESSIWPTVRAHLARADAVIFPAAPLAHADHRLLATVILQNASEIDSELYGYLEQPYATNRSTFAVRESRGWIAVRLQPEEHLLKIRALGEYRSQLRLLTPLPRLRVALYQAARGERVCMLSPNAQGDPTSLR